jgi:acetoin utilization protein AcuB
MISPNALAAEAQHILVDNHIRHLPVVGDGKRLQGLITRRSLALDPESLGSLNVWEITRYVASIKVKEMMIPAKEVVTVNPNRSIERAADILSENKIGCLPVVEDKNIVVGIITEIDVLESFKEMLALRAAGVRVTVRTPDRAGEFKRLTSILGDQNWGVMGIGTYPSPRHEGFYDTVVKIPRVSITDVQAVFDQIDEIKVVDIREAI